MSTRQDKHIIILAAGQGTRLRPLTDGVPKCMVKIHGRPLIEWQLETIKKVGGLNPVIVGGYNADKLKYLNVPMVINHDYANTNMVLSLLCAQEYFGNEFLMAYGDIIYNREILEAVRDDNEMIGVAVDRDWLPYWKMRTDDVLGDAESLRVDKSGQHILSLGQKETDVERIQGQYIGLVAFHGQGINAILELTCQERALSDKGSCGICRDRPLARMYMTDLLQGLITRSVAVGAVWINGGWLEVDNVSDLRLGEQLARPKDGGLHVCR